MLWKVNQHPSLRGSRPRRWAQKSPPGCPHVERFEPTRRCPACESGMNVPGVRPLRIVGRGLLSFRNNKVRKDVFMNLRVSAALRGPNIACQPNLVLAFLSMLSQAHQLTTLLCLSPHFEHKKNTEWDSSVQQRLQLQSWKRRSRSQQPSPFRKVWTLIGFG